MTKPTTKNTVSIENRSGGPLQIELPADAKVPEEFRVLYLGDPVDRSRKADDGLPLPQPEIEVPADVWERFEEVHPAFLQGLVERGELVIRY